MRPSRGVGLDACQGTIPADTVGFHWRSHAFCPHLPNYSDTGWNQCDSSPLGSQEVPYLEVVFSYPATYKSFQLCAFIWLSQPNHVFSKAAVTNLSDLTNHYWSADHQLATTILENTRISGLHNVQRNLTLTLGVVILLCFKWTSVVVSFSSDHVPLWTSCNTLFFHPEPGSSLFSPSKKTYMVGSNHLCRHY